MAHDGRLNEQKWRKAYYPSVFQFCTDMAEDTDVLGELSFLRGELSGHEVPPRGRVALHSSRARHRSVWHSHCVTACARLRRSRVSQGPLAACAATKAPVTIVARVSEDLNPRQFHNNSSALLSALLGQISAPGNGQHAGAVPGRRAVDGRVLFGRARHAGMVRYPRSHRALLMQIFSTVCFGHSFEPSCDAVLVAPPGRVSTAPRAPNTAQGSCVGNSWPPCVPDAVFAALCGEVRQCVGGLYLKHFQEPDLRHSDICWQLCLHGCTRREARHGHRRALRS